LRDIIWIIYELVKLKLIFSLLLSPLKTEVLIVSFSYCLCSSIRTRWLDQSSVFFQIPFRPSNDRLGRILGRHKQLQATFLCIGKTSHCKKAANQSCDDWSFRSNLRRHLFDRVSSRLWSRRRRAITLLLLGISAH